MTRAGVRRVFAGLVASVLCVVAQSNRDAYRAAYQSWREADPNLELDAGTAGSALGARTDKAAVLASGYGAAHAAALRNLADRQAQNLQMLRANTEPLPDLAPPPDTIRFANREISAVSASASTFANDPDKAIQQLRQAFEREQAALEALKSVVVDRQQAEDKAVKAVSSVEIARSNAMEQYTFLTSALSQSADLMNQETAAWADYYPKLSDAARNANVAPPRTPPQANLPVSVAPSGEPPPAPRAPSITPLPLSRYVGVWNYQAGSAFHGSEPEFVDLVVHEDNGHATGTFYARFKVPPGSTGDPVLRFDFSGDFKPNRIQTFPLKTAEGATGSIDLIPGRAFNEIEVNFDTEIKPGKVHQGDILLVKQ